MPEHTSPLRRWVAALVAAGPVRSTLLDLGWTPPDDIGRGIVVAEEGTVCTDRAVAWATEAGPAGPV